MSIIVCVSLGPIDSPSVRKYIENAVAPYNLRVVFGSTPEDFSAVKSSGNPITLAVFGAQGCAIIENLCDDYMAARVRRVKFVYSITAGVDAYHLENLKRQLVGIPFHNAQGCYDEILAEHVVFGMIYFNRQAWRFVASKNGRHWDRYNMIGLRGQKVGVIGYGSIGQACGKMAAAMGMQVTGIRRSASALGEVDQHGIRIRNNDALDQVLCESDFVVGVLPGTAETAHFFNERVFSLMKPSAVFISIGRGCTQDEEALTTALNRNTIRGAVLDVFEKEPLPECSPLWSIPDDKLLMSAHCADWTESVTTCSIDRFAAILGEYCAKGKSDAYCVDVDKGY